MIVLDTHALLWWALDPDQLSGRARDLVAQMERRGGFASSISVWELGIKVQRGKLDLGIDIEEFAKRVRMSGVVELLPVDATVWLRSLALEWDHRDPADRVIVATALLNDVPVLTKDETIHSFEGITALW
ncbi:MAG TPA: type II toxin-antitoxin system VapC family toxin [Polyangiaceae bacterium]|nr:type II toxin-antitoxin system VapC family toxin [Polyangiaceae bacterium]